MYKTHLIKFDTIGIDPIEARKNLQQFYDLVEKDTNDWELIKEKEGIFLFKTGMELVQRNREN